MLRKNASLLRKLKRLGKKFGFRLIDADNPKEKFEELLRQRDTQTVKSLDLSNQFLSFVTQNIERSSGQLCQDLFVLFTTEYKTGGFFVEFGATDGVKRSNSYLLEKEYAWSGILAEPARKWHDDLRKNRNNQVDTRCVWEESHKLLEFNEVDDGEFSTINAFSKTDKHSSTRKKGTTYSVESVSLTDLLKTHQAPLDIDYLSIDTEGSEFTILRAFDFDRYNIRIITVEHNYRPEREEIYSLLTKQGYLRVLEEFSQWDDWYIKVDSFPLWSAPKKQL